MNIHANVNDYLNIGLKQQPTPNVSSAIQALFTGQTYFIEEEQAPLSSPSVVCIDDAGTLTVTIDGNAAPLNMINYANWGASIVYTHSGGDASQDGDVTSAPGFDIGIYQNGAADSTGPTAASINADANYTGQVVGTNISGNISFNNTGGYQSTFNAGNPVHLWFHPVTLDDHANQDLTENAGGPNECVNVNPATGTNIVFLNQIDTSLFTNPAVPNGDNCEARIRLHGGIPQWDGSQYTITITKSTAPFTPATITTMTHLHNSLLEFNVSEPGDYDIVVSDGNGASRTFTVPMNNCVICNDTAGTASVALGTTAASTNASYLCFGDSMIVTHDGNAILTGDPDPNTASGLGYVMYTCAPTTAGNTVASIAADPCIVNQSMSSAGFDLVSGTDINGNVNIFNNGTTYQNILGGLGSVGQLWFAPITIDDHANGGFEATGTPNECTNVSIGSPFSIIFLNEIQANNFSTNMCDGSFQVTGGLPQFDASAYTITIELTTNTLITGTVTNSPVTHNGTVNFTVPQPGIYRVTVIDNIGCGSPNNTNTFLIDMNACPFPCTGVVNATMNVTSNFSGSPISCNGASDGQITVSVNGGTPPLTYDWSHDNMLTTNTAANLTAGSYTVTVTDNNGCADTQTVVLTQPNILALTLGSTPILCNGDMSSSVFVTSLTGGTAPYTYSWSSGTVVPTNDTIINVGAGTYTLTITDANNCTINESVTLTDPAALTSSMTDISNTDCSSSANGSATVVPSGGTVTFNDYNYAWSHDGSLNDSVATGLTDGITYYVTVTDDNGCTTVDSVILSATKTIVTAMDSLDVDCNGASTGMAWVNVTTMGGTANLPYSYSWSHDMLLDNDTAMNLTAGTYIVTVSDALGCSTVDSIVVNEPDTIGIAIQSITNVNCAGDLTGAATISVTGGTAPYSYNWLGNSSVSPTISNVGAGTYLVTVTDANNCTETGSVTIGQNSVISLTQIDTTALTCAGDMNGGFVMTYSGGTMPYSYAWSTDPVNDTLNTITGIGAGTYYVTMTDDLGCQRIDTLVLTEPTAITGTVTTTNLTCANDQNGTAIIVANGGTMPYTYTWSANSVNNDTITGLGAGTIYVTVTDANGCTYVDSSTITAPPAISISVATTPVSCVGGNDGTATATVTGGNGGFTYLWDSTQTGQTATQLSVGQHVLIVTDQAGCQMTDTFTITSIPPLLPSSISSNPVSCFGGSDGSASIEVTGGTAPYTYLWTTNPPQDSSTAVGLSQGTYQVFVIDANGCSMTPISITVNEPPALVIDSITTIDPLCNNSDDGSVTVYPSGGTPSYSYAWSNNNETTNTNNNLFAGSYTVTVTDANGCTTTGSANLNDPLMLVAQMSTTPTTCNGGKDGRIQIDTVLGGFGPYEYSIDGTNFLPVDVIFFGLFGGNYDVTVRDANGCTFVQTVLIEEPPLITVDLGPDIELDLGDSVQLQAFVNTSETVTYIWETSDSGSLSCFDCSDPWANPTSSVDYFVTVVDSNGCEATDDIFIKIDKNRRVFIPSAFTPNGDGTNDRFVIYGGTGVDEIISFKVFNRWGELVHSADNFAPGSYQHGWDGSFRGRALNPAVFVYFIEVRFSDGVVFPYKGDITLIR
jgi:gliding motility-associated-like protein